MALLSARGPQIRPQQFPTAPQRIFTVWFCSVHQPAEKMWDRVSAVVGIPQTLPADVLSAHWAGAYVQAPEIFKREVHPHASLWLRRRCAMSATLSTEVFSEPLTPWSFWGSGKEKRFLPRSSALAISPSFHPYIPKRGEEQEHGRRLCKPQGHVQLRQACAGT